MFKRPITYVDFNGETVTDECYFNMNHTEIMEMEWAGAGGSLTEEFKRMTLENDRGAMFALIKKFILDSYGIKSPDGKVFFKKDPITDKPLNIGFEQTAAFNQLIVEMAQDANVAADFINGVVPQDVRDGSFEAKANAQTPIDITALVTKPVDPNFATLQTRAEETRQQVIDTVESSRNAGLFPPPPPA